MDPFTVGVGGASAIVAAAGAIVQVVNFAVGVSGAVEPTYGAAASTLDDARLKRIQALSGGQLDVISRTRYRIPFRFYRHSAIKTQVDWAAIGPKAANLVKHVDDEPAAKAELYNLIDGLHHSKTRVQIPLQIDCEIVGFRYRFSGQTKTEYQIRTATVRPWHADVPYLNFFQEKASLQFMGHSHPVEGLTASYVVFSWHFRSDGRRFRASGGEKQGDLRLGLTAHGVPELTVVPEGKNIEKYAIQEGEKLSVGAVLTAVDSKPAKDAKDGKDAKDKKDAKETKDGKDGKDAPVGVAVRDRNSGAVPEKLSASISQAAGAGDWQPDRDRTLVALRQFLKDRYGVPASHAPSQLRLDIVFERYEVGQWILHLSHHSGDLYAEEASAMGRKLRANPHYRGDSQAADLVRRMDAELDREFGTFLTDRIQRVEPNPVRAREILEDYLERLGGLLGQRVPEPGKILHTAKSGLVEIDRALGTSPEAANARVPVEFAGVVDAADAVRALLSWAGRQGLAPTEARVGRRIREAFEPELAAAASRDKGKGKEKNNGVEQGEGDNS